MIISTSAIRHDPLCSCRTNLFWLDCPLDRTTYCDLIDGPLTAEDEDPIFVGTVGAFLDVVTGDTEYYYDNPIEQGMYDDDPSPYAGTYSEE